MLPLFNYGLFDSLSYRPCHSGFCLSLYECRASAGELEPRLVIPTGYNQAGPSGLAPLAARQVSAFRTEAAAINGSGHMSASIKAGVIKMTFGVLPFFSAI